MTSIELYINNRLCDISKDFAIRINRQLLNPSELQTKDAQFSYSVTLPSSKTNNEIFKNTHIEETAGKFNDVFSAELIINAQRVFIGNFLMTGISKNSYSGNLYVPEVRSIKDIFGNIKMNQNAPYRVPFLDFAESVTYYNNLAKTEKPMCIFPLVLYGLLPKVPTDRDLENYTARDVFDSSVRLGMSDLPPSINVVGMLEHIFETKGFALSGSALSDDRLTNLYMSYKNAPDYVQPWNYGTQARMAFRGSWSNVKNMRDTAAGQMLERGVFENTDTDGRGLYGVDMLDATNTAIEIIEDRGANINTKLLLDQYGRYWSTTQIAVPATGFYKIKLDASLKVDDTKNYRVTDTGAGGTDVQFVSGNSGLAFNGLENRRFEIKVLRDHKGADFALANAKIDGVFNRNNLPQNNTFDEENIPKYYPQILTTPSGKPYQTQLIDLAQNSNFVVGLAWGKKGDRGYEPINPKDTAALWSQVMIAKPALSFDSSENSTPAPRLAFDNAGYWKFGRIGVYDSDTDIPAGDVPDVDAIGWELTRRFEQTVEGQGEVFARRGYNQGIASNPDWNGDGSVSAIVWLEAGELLTVANISDEGRYRKDSSMSSRYGMVMQEMTFEVSIEPFQTQKEWLKVDFRGNGTQPMNWNDPTDFDVDEIDLTKFLPADTSTNDFIDNLCKAFNLRLSQISKNEFSLDVKQATSAVSSIALNLDNRASVASHENSPLGLPAMYKLGFTIDEDERGFFLTKDDGGGFFETGAISNTILEQKSSFSYNWFADITKTQEGGDVLLKLPVISKQNVWFTSESYYRSMLNRFTDSPARFWYYDGTLNENGASFYFNGAPLTLAKVSNTLVGRNTLNYKNNVLTILRNYFTVLVNASSHYTEIECYITPDEYAALDGSVPILFNGDIYYVAEVQGYDPTNTNKTKLKLIRKI